MLLLYILLKLQAVKMAEILGCSPVGGDFDL